MSGFNNRAPKPRWTREEKQFLLAHWPGKTKAEKEAIYAFLHRHSPISIRTYAHHKGLCKPQTDAKEIARRRQVLFDALEEGDKTVEQLAALTGWDYRYVRKELWALRDAGQAHPLPTPIGKPKLWTAGRLASPRPTTEDTMSKLRANVGNPFGMLMPE